LTWLGPPDRDAAKALTRLEQVLNGEIANWRPAAEAEPKPVRRSRRKDRKGCRIM
jgi:hypothetical protein